VKCDFTDSLLHSYFDDELSTLDALEFGRHAEQCADCGTTLVNLDLLVARCSSLNSMPPRQHRC